MKAVEWIGVVVGRSGAIGDNWFVRISEETKCFGGNELIFLGVFVGGSDREVPNFDKMIPETFPALASELMTRIGELKGASEELLNKVDLKRIPSWAWAPRVIAGLAKRIVDFQQEIEDQKNAIKGIQERKKQTTT